MGEPDLLGDRGVGHPTEGSASGLRLPGMRPVRSVIVISESGELSRPSR